MDEVLRSERIVGTYTVNEGGIRASWTADVDPRGVMVMFEPQIWLRAVKRGESAEHVIDGLCAALKGALLKVATHPSAV